MLYNQNGRCFEWLVEIAGLQDDNSHIGVRNYRAMANPDFRRYRIGGFQGINDYKIIKKRRTRRSQTEEILWLTKKGVRREIYFGFRDDVYYGRGPGRRAV
jgi:hypothetical protein